MNEKFPSPGEAGAKLLNINDPLAAKYSTNVLACRLPRLVPGPLPSGRSMSENTTPNPRVEAVVAPAVPGIAKTVSVTLLPMGENNRPGLND